MPKSAPKQTIRLLNEVLTAELTAVNQYFLHAEMCGNWGYSRLHDRIRKESMDEMKHAKQLIDRILFLGGVPNVQRMGKIQVGTTVQELLQNDLALEQEAVPRLNEAIEQLHTAKDHGSRLILESILSSEEGHLDWLEAQLEQIEQVGIGNYLAEQTAE